MPELPDLTVYIEALERRTLRRRLARIRLVSPFVLRSVDPGPAELEGRRVAGVRRIGKRIAFELEGERFAIVHLMIAGRLRWRETGAALNRKLVLAAFDFEGGDLHLTEASSKRRAGIWLARGEDALRAHDPGGVEPLEADAAAFRAALLRENHTLKRALTDPSLFAGIGNA
jgi:formamidopyrimidine-DNA glycosylase